MYVEQLYTNCLAEAAYYIESEGEAAIIDPLRDPQPYIFEAESRKAKIKYIFETHFHADFVSGHLDLSRETGAPIVFGPNAETGFDAIVAEDGQEFKIGNATIKVIHTPGHTMESTTYLLIDEDGKEHSIFSGDTLFIGDVGRPDLAVKSDLSKEDLASLLYDSLRNKILPLPDDVIVYPGNGAGSSCGKNMSEETSDTLGNQKQTNYALDPKLSKEAFIKEVTEIAPPPQYFPKNAMMNKTGYAPYDEVKSQAMKALDLNAFKTVVDQGALILDTRHEDDFGKSHIPGSMNIPLNGMFAIWVGTLIADLHQPLALVTEPGLEEETVMRLARVGYDKPAGYLQGGVEAWKLVGNETVGVEGVSAEQVTQMFEENPKMNIVDVRKPGEYEAEHVENSIPLPLDYMIPRLGELDKDETYYVHCKSGYRSMIANSIMERAGFKKVIDVKGGFDALLETSIPKTDYVCPTTQKEESHV